MTIAHDVLHPEPRIHLKALAENWRLLLLRGILSIAVGALAIAWPGATLIALVLLYGCLALVDGGLSLLVALTGRARSVPTWWLVLVGIAGVAAGLAVLMWPGASALVLILMIGAWAVVHGVLEIIGAIQLRGETGSEWLLILAGAVSVLFGLLLLTAPGIGGLALAWTFGAYAIAFGAALVAFSLRLRRHHERIGKTT